MRVIWSWRRQLRFLSGEFQLLTQVEGSFYTHETPSFLRGSYNGSANGTTNIIDGGRPPDDVADFSLAGTDPLGA